MNNIFHLFPNLVNLLGHWPLMPLYFVGSFIKSVLAKKLENIYFPNLKKSYNRMRDLFLSSNKNILQKHSLQFLQRTSTVCQHVLI